MSTKHFLSNQDPTRRPSQSKASRRILCRSAHWRQKGSQLGRQILPCHVLHFVLVPVRMTQKTCTAIINLSPEADFCKALTNYRRSLAKRIAGITSMAFTHISMSAAVAVHLWCGRRHGFHKTSLQSRPYNATPALGKPQKSYTAALGERTNQCNLPMTENEA